MRRQTGTLASILILLALFAGISLAQKPVKEKPLPKFEPAQVLSTTDVVYPLTSVAFGSVALEVTVGENGEAEDIKVMRDIPSLTREAKRAVEKWTFSPAKLDGKPIRSTITVVVVFNKPCVAP